MDFHDILSTRGLNTLTFTDPYAKLCFTSLLTGQFDRTLYFDLDTTFAAYYSAGLVRSGGTRIDIFLPSEGRAVQMAQEIIESMPSASLVIFDSVNSFYSLFPIREKNLGGLNHLLSIMLMLLVRRGVDSGVPVLATSMLRYRHAGGWVQSPASRRLLQNKSAVKMMVESLESKDSFLVRIMEHDTLPPDTEIVYENSVSITA
ncbi:MAG: hypothetical protein MN733_17510 [Nitrososphaera sp.]|nr:hypothetical protein [Nitrososphaera sp.]